MSFRQPSVLPGFGLTLAHDVLPQHIVLLPLAALALAAPPCTGATSCTWCSVRGARLLPPVLRRLLPAATINLVFGFIIAWTLVRTSFRQKLLTRSSYALRAAHGGLGIALTTVFAHNGWIGRYLEPWGVKVAYTWLA